MMSDVDDKDDPNFFPKDLSFHRLPQNVKDAINLSKSKAKHS